MVEATFVGGLHWPSSLGTTRVADAPLTRLCISDIGVTIGPSSRLAKLITLGSIPTYEFPWATITHVERVKKGVRFFVHDMDKSVIFVVDDDTALRILSLVENNDVRVDRNMHQVRWWEQADL